MKDNRLADLNFWVIMLGLVLLLVSALWNPAKAASGESLQASRGPVMLNENISISGTIIHLGDLFDGVGDKARIAIAYAPEPGKRAFFDVNWLYRVAQRYRLAWKPLSLKQRAVVERSSLVIGTEEIKDHILAALIEKGIDADVSVELNNRMLRLHVPGDSSATMAVEDISFNPSTRRFTASIVAPVNGPVPTRTRVTGKIFKMLEIPVLNHRLARGEIIRGRDIKWIEIRSKQTGRNVIIDEADLIGMSAKRALRMNTPIRVSEVGQPVLVNKGSLVVMTLNTPLMRLTAQGKAQESGVEGETVRILNTQSNKVIQAIVTSSGQVRVIPVSHIAMN